MFGLKQEHIDAIRRCFSAIPAIREVVIYGSRAKETHKPGSDIDLTIIDDDISSSDLVRLDSALDDLMLPYKFDLSLKRKIKNPDLIDHINRVGKVFYMKSTDKNEWKEREYAFYSAVSNNDSAQELMGKDKLKELAIVLTETIRQNTSIDWTIKENVKARLKVSVKRLLRKYGYPPDMQLLATETVLKQAEMIAEELIK
jgi:type I restriction enzyme R subunit